METIGDAWVPRLKELYSRMDDTYSALAALVDFTCLGCDGSKCCEVDLKVHTFVESLYLRRGFYLLDVSLQHEIVNRCHRVLNAKQVDPLGEEYRSSVCVLNVEGLCSVYQYRPMICRLAGIKHYFIKPDGTKISGRGCSVYENTIAQQFPESRIDRTEFYKDMTRIEIEIITELGRRPDSLTVAEILCPKGPNDNHIR